METYNAKSFTYDAEQDAYICKNKCVLKFSRYRRNRGYNIYKSKVSDCAGCPHRDKCISGKMKYKEVTRPCHKAEYDKQHENNATPAYKAVQRLRKIWCEGTFAHQKANHCMAKAKMRGIAQTTGQCLLSACAVNIKRMLKFLRHHTTTLDSSIFFACLSFRKAFS